MLRKIRQVGVLGAGVMGGGVAALMAGAGLKTLLLDIVPSDLNETQRQDPVARNRVVKAGLDAALMAQPPLFMQFKDAYRVTIGNMEDDFHKLEGCDWIVEAVVERLDIKKEVLKRVEKIRKKGSIVSSNTSGIPLREMSEGLSLEFRQHFMGTHFFNPVRYMRLLEIIPGEETIPELLEFMSDFGQRVLGKGIVRAKDTPNFIANRIGAHGMAKLMHLMMEENFTIPEVDALFGPALGRPKTAVFKTADLVGLDVLGHVAGNTYERVSADEERECFRLPGFVQTLIGKKLLGNKTRAGFYKTDLTPDWKKVPKVINPKTLEYEAYEKPAFECLKAADREASLPAKLRAVLYADDREGRFAWKAMAGSLIYAANRIPEIADTVVQIDDAMRWGFNFEMGPFETWDAIGVPESVKKMDQDGLTAPPRVKAMLESGCTSFYRTENGTTWYYDLETGGYKIKEPGQNLISLNGLKRSGKLVKSCGSASLVDLGDGVFCCEFHSKMNSLNGEMVDFMQHGIDFIESNGIGLVIGNQAGGMPGAFSAGGDLEYMAGLARQGNYNEMGAFLARGQQGIQDCRYAPFPVVAAPFGLTLGGGFEVCLGADRMVAHADLFMGFVEVGVGLLPGGGGCLNLWRKYLESIPDAVSDLDLGKFFVPVMMAIATAKISSSAADARANGFLGPRDRIVMNRDHLIAEAKKDVIKLVDEGYCPPVKQKIKVMGQAAQGMISAEIHNLLKGNFVSDYDAYLARRIAFVVSGGDVRENSEIDEEVILSLERETFVDLWKQEKTLARVEHMLKTGRPLRN